MQEIELERFMTLLKQLKATAYYSFWGGRILIWNVLLCLLSFNLFGARLPDITPSDVKETLQQILDAHASHKCLNSLLVQRALQNYIEEIDPTKTYLLSEDIQEWLAPTEEFLNAALEKIEKNDFSVFEAIQVRMIKAVHRRTRLEKEIEGTPAPDNVTFKEFKDISWAKTEEELRERLIKLQALQKITAEKLDLESKEKTLQRILKKRLSREEELSSENPRELEKCILSYALKALASSLDAHTAYFTPAEAAQFMIQVQQRLFGIGVQLRDDLNGFTIVKVIEGGPGVKANLKDNDRIIAVDGEPVVGMDILDAVELIRGDENSTVRITVLREQEKEEIKLDVDVIRGEVVIKEARLSSSAIPFGDGVIAHISLFAFYQDPLHSSAEDIHAEILKIRKEHKLKGVVLDLRHNSGGVLPQAVSVTGLFITKGIVVSIKDNKGMVEHLRNIEGKTAWDGPLLVLTSKASASAAEIVAQTLQDYGRAIIVGDPHTYGKGTFQTFSLDACNCAKVNPKGEFKVTRGRYYTVSGKSPQLEGVKPDIVIPGVFSDLDIGEELAKYPLENDSIPENFHDDLSDIPVVQRDQISWLYRFNLQPCLKTYTQLIPALLANSEKRLKNDTFYKNFLAALEAEENSNNGAFDVFIQADLQLREAINIMKDLIVLLK